MTALKKNVRFDRSAPRVASYVLSKPAHAKKSFQALPTEGQQLELGGTESSLIACVHVPLLPLQLALRSHPEWRNRPLVVIDEDKPNGTVLYTNAVARRTHITTGMRYAAARSITSDLRATVLDEPELVALHEDLARGLSLLSPRVEPTTELGLFFIDPSGLEQLFGDLPNWAQSVHRYLAGRGLSSSVVVGSHRFRTEVIARTRRGPLVLGTPARERDLAMQVRLDRIGVSPKLRDALAKLGVHTLAHLVALSRDALHARFGPEAATFHDRATTGMPLPVQHKALRSPVTTSLELDPPENDTTRLLFVLRAPIRECIEGLVVRDEALSKIEITLALERRSTNAGPRAIQLSIEPAKPTRDDALLSDLLRLRLAALVLEAPVESVTLLARGASYDRTQLDLFPVKAKRDLDAAARGIARVRAALGPTSVVRPRLASGHLPEASFRWEQATSIRAPRALEGVGVLKNALGHQKTRLARVLLARPQPLPDLDRQSDTPWPGIEPVMRLVGPHRLSGGWWAREVERDYYYAYTRANELLWVFYDRGRRRWFLHGRVE